MFRNLLAEGTLSQSFMPIFSNYEKESIEEARKVTGIILMFLFVGLVLFIGLFLSIAPYVLPKLVGGTQEYSRLIIELTFILFFLIMTASLSSIFMSISNLKEKFFIPSLSPILLNLSYLFVFLIIFPSIDEIDIEKRIKILSFGIVTGGILQLVVQAGFVYYLGLFPSFSKPSFHPAIKKLFKVMLPAVLGGGFYQIGLLLDIFIANYIQNFHGIDGAVVSLDYSQRLVQLPTGIIGVALATTILPSLLNSMKNNDTQSLPSEIQKSLSFGFFLTLPASVGLIIWAEPILNALFYGGLWNDHSTKTTILPLMFYAMAIPFYSFNKILVSSYYAFQDTKTPLKIQGIVLVFNLILILITFNILHHGSIAIASFFGSMMTSTFLLRNLKKHKISLPIKLIIKSLIPFLFPATIMGITCVYLKNNYYFPETKDWGSRLFLGWGLPIAGGFYFALVYPIYKLGLLGKKT
jgi:putative peptidoglycan lipid II flippase